MNKYIVLVVIAAVAGIALILKVSPAADPLLVIGAVFLGLMQVLQLIKVNEAAVVAKDIKAVAEETHKSVNSRLDAFIRNAESAARAEGRTAGMKESEDRVDALSKEKYSRDQGITE